MKIAKSNELKKCNLDALIFNLYLKVGFKQFQRSYDILNQNIPVFH